jgi:hypothetical protein
MCGMAGIENFFEEGNERSTTYFTSNDTTTKAGFHIESQQKFFLLNEFVNEKEKEQWVWLAVNYEYLPGPLTDYKKAHFMLLSVGPSCASKTNPFGVSNMTIGGQPKSKVFAEHSIPWTSPWDGTVLGTGGHLHDGGKAVKVYLNDKLICDSVANYAAGASGMGDTMATMQGGKKSDYDTGAAHIATISGCPVGQRIAKGDKVRLVAEYDFNEHPGLKNNKGELDEVMGMAGFLVAADT